MKLLEKIVRMPQDKLFKFLRTEVFPNNIYCMNKYILVPGSAPVMLIAHLDTVHKSPVRDICISQDKNIWMSPQGIGGDDRCGVYTLIKARLESPVHPWLLFTCDEEVGGLGAEAFVDDYVNNVFDQEILHGIENLKLLVEIDRKGSDNAVYYECDNNDLEKYISSKGFVTSFGSFSDISIIAPDLGIAAVNLSSGYYHAHTEHEYINISELNTVISKVKEIIDDSTKVDMPVYIYIPIIRKYGIGNLAIYNYPSYSKDSSWDYYYKVPDDVPEKYKQQYEELLTLYDSVDLNDYRQMYGEDFIEKLYKSEFSFPI